MTGRIGRLAGVTLLAVVCWMAWAASALAASPPALSGTLMTSPNLDLAEVTAVAVAPPVGTHAYGYATASYSGQLTAIDVSNPASLVDAGTTAPQPSLIGGSNVALANGLAYVVSKNHNVGSPATANDDGSGNALTIVDIHTDPAHPAVVGAVHEMSTPRAALFGAYGIAVQGNYAFIAAQGVLKGQPSKPDTSSGAFTVVDVSNPASPSIVNSIGNDALPGSWAGTNALQHATSVAISGNYAYVSASYDDRLTVIDISQPTNPRIVASLRDSTNLSFDVDVAIQGHYAYVADQGAGSGHSQGVTVVDISNPLNPQVTGVATSSWLNSSYRIRVRGNFAYVATFAAGTISAVDISDPANPRFAGGIYDPVHLSETSGLDLDPHAQYVIAVSPDRPPGFVPPLGSVSAVGLDPSAPHVGIHSSSEPPNPTAQTSADFTFVTANQVVTMRCSLDGAPPGLCGSPGDQQYTGLPAGTHTFTVQAIDPAGSVASASYTWTIHLVPKDFVSIRNPSNGAIFSKGETAHARYSCTAASGTSLRSCTGPVANGSKLNTATVGHHTFTVLATNANGRTTTGSTHYTVIAGPVLSGVSQLHKRWRETKARPGLKNLPVGTEFKFSLNERSRVSLAFTQPQSGRKVIGTIVLPHATGPVVVSFTGYASHKRLRPGTYNLVITATAGGHSSVSKRLSFVVVA